MHKKGVIEQKADSVGFSLHNIHFDDTTRSALYADSFFFTVKHYAYLTPDSLYQLAVSMARLDSKSKSLSLKNVSYQPIVKDEEYKRRRTYQHDRYKVGIDQIKATGIDFYALFTRKNFWPRA